MFKSLLSLVVIAVSLNLTQAETTPADFKIPEEKVTRIECDFKEKYPSWAEFGYKEECPSKSKKVKGYHYDIYLPPGYYADSKKRYPCIFITSPGGNARLGALKNWVKEKKWIAVMLIESRNGSPDWLRNFCAAHDDVIKRVRIQEGLKFATGFSGGARCSSVYVGVRPGFAGLILQGAGFIHDGRESRYNSTENKDLSIYMVCGNNDSNKVEIETLHKKIPERVPFKHELFDGKHQWAPEDSMIRALEWQEKQIINTTQNRDVARIYFLKLYEEIKENKSDYKQYMALKDMGQLADRYKLDDKSDKEILNKIKVKIRQLSQTKEIKKEITAEKAFITAEKAEERYRKYLKKRTRSAKSHNNTINKIIKEFLRVSKYYQGTVFGAKAKEKAELLETEKK
jgi:hypothetical protein